MFALLMAGSSIAVLFFVLGEASGWQRGWRSGLAGKAETQDTFYELGKKHGRENTVLEMSRYKALRRVARTRPDSEQAWSDAEKEDMSIGEKRLRELVDLVEETEETDDEES